MQNFYYKKPRLPYNNDKSPKLFDTNKEGKEHSFNVEQNTLEKLLIQLDQQKHKYENEKRELIDSYNLQVQQKMKQFQKVETELTMKISLLEQLLFQEQNKTIHLTRIIQDKEKSKLQDKEKEQYKNKISQLESILQESQRNNQKPLSKGITKDNFFKMFIDTISFIQSQVFNISKQKRLNISWMDYDILQNDLQKQKDVGKTLLRLNQIFTSFFKLLSEQTTPQLSPYRIGNKSPHNDSEQKQCYSARDYKPDIKQLITNSTQTKNESILFEKSTQTINFNNIISNYTQTQEIIIIPQFNQKIDVQIQTINYKNVESKFIQTDIKIENNNILQISKQIQTDYLFIQQIEIETQTENLLRDSLLQLKHRSKITEKDEEEENESIIQQKDETDSIFDCNKPDYDSIIEHHEELVDLRKECQENKITIQLMEKKITQLILEKDGFQFDNLFTSSQYSINDLINNHWTIKLKDNNAQQICNIAFISQEIQLIEIIIQSIYNSDYNVNLNYNQMAIQQYNKGFIEQYNLELMFKLIKFPKEYIIDSQKILQEMQFEMFWLEFIIEKCSEIFFLCNQFTQNESKLIEYIQQQNKKICIITFEDLKINGFQNQQNYSKQIQYQILKIQFNKDIIKSLCTDILQSEWQWKLYEDSYLGQLQQFIQPKVQNEDFMQIQITEDGLFELHIIEQEINQSILFNIPYIKEIQINLKQIILNLNLDNDESIIDIKCIKNKVIIFTNKFIILEQLNNQIQFKQIEDNKIILTNIDQQ